MFTLQVTHHETGGQPLVASMSISVSVQDPELVATSISSGTATITGNAKISDVLKAGSLSTTGGLNVTGKATIKELDAINGTVSMFGACTMLASGTDFGSSHYAQTDGFAVIRILPPPDMDERSFAYGTITTEEGHLFQVQGGNIAQFGTWRNLMGPNSNTMTIPTRAKTTWKYQGNSIDRCEVKSVIEVWWFPVGRND